MIINLMIAALRMTATREIPAEAAREETAEIARRMSPNIPFLR